MAASVRGKSPMLFVLTFITGTSLFFDMHQIHAWRGRDGALCIHGPEPPSVDKYLAWFLTVLL